MAPPPPPPLDLHHLSTLFAYEITSYEPRFRHAILNEATPSWAENPISCSSLINMYEIDESVDVRRFRFDVDQTLSSSNDEPDSPSTMLPTPLPAHRGLDTLTSQDVDDIFHEVRQHNGCYRAASLLQLFFRLLPPNYPVLIRTAKGKTVTSSTGRYLIWEWKIHTPRTITSSTVFHPETQTYLTGNRNLDNHTTVTFSTDTFGEDYTLDLSSMQFGPKGRGQGGEPFWLGSTVDWHGQLMKGVCVGGAQDYRGAGSLEVAPTGDEKDARFQRKVVEKVKRRWEAGSEVDKGCGFCGKPDAMKKCACGEARYCSLEHQKSGRGFHKKFCSWKKK